LHAHRRAAARTAEACVDASWWLLVPILLRLFNTTRTTSGTPSTGAAISDLDYTESHGQFRDTRVLDSTRRSYGSIGRVSTTPLFTQHWGAQSDMFQKKFWTDLPKKERFTWVAMGACASKEPTAAGPADVRLDPEPPARAESPPHLNVEWPPGTASTCKQHQHTSEMLASAAPVAAKGDARCTSATLPSLNSAADEVETRAPATAQSPISDDDAGASPPLPLLDPAADVDTLAIASPSATADDDPCTTNAAMRSLDPAAAEVETLASRDTMTTPTKRSSSGNQSQSEAISGNQWQSVAISTKRSSSQFASQRVSLATAQIPILATGTRDSQPTPPMRTKCYSKSAADWAAARAQTPTPEMKLVIETVPAASPHTPPAAAAKPLPRHPSIVATRAPPVSSPAAGSVWNEFLEASEMQPAMAAIAALRAHFEISERIRGLEAFEALITRAETTMPARVKEMMRALVRQLMASDGL